MAADIIEDASRRKIIPPYFLRPAVASAEEILLKPPIQFEIEASGDAPFSLHPHAARPRENHAAGPGQHAMGSGVLHPQIVPEGAQANVDQLGNETIHGAPSSPFLRSLGD